VKSLGKPRQGTFSVLLTAKTKPMQMENEEIFSMEPQQVRTPEELSSFLLAVFEK
jgi:hypothetical protein